GMTPLIYAVKAGNAEVIRRLLASGADPSLKDWGGHDALWHARQRAGSDDIVRLLQSGAETKP
ncbi:MAG: ankyrin repeat domain-containing protein, partial [Ottowia sp.]|nr:ankyrin repeat domain-containing protein [Ottowia sp.]